MVVLTGNSVSRDRQMVLFYLSARQFGIFVHVVKETTIHREIQVESNSKEIANKQASPVSFQRGPSVFVDEDGWTIASNSRSEVTTRLDRNRQRLNEITRSRFLDGS